MKRNKVNETVAIGYVRVSTDEQQLGPQAQRDVLARWCAAQGVQLVAVYEDLGISGGAELERRPGLLSALEALTVHKAGVLLVAKRDRLARDYMIAGMIERLAERAGARVMACDGTGNGDGPEAMLLRGIADVFAQYERALIRARTRAALQVKKSRLEYTGGEPPYGWRLSADHVHIERDDTEQTMICMARELQDLGLSLRAIGAELEVTGFLPRRAAHWNPKTVRDLLEAA